MKELKGVHGWLWWATYIVIGLGGIVGHSIYAIWYTDHYGVTSGLIMAGAVALATAALVGLRRLSPKGVTWAKSYFAYTIVLWMLAPSVTFIIGGYEFPASNMAWNSVVWLVYFLVSKRVKYTYFSGILFPTQTSGKRALQS